MALLLIRLRYYLVFCTNFKLIRMSELETNTQVVSSNSINMQGKSTEAGKKLGWQQ